jgi:hypothetical protein
VRAAAATLVALLAVLAAPAGAHAELRLVPGSVEIAALDSAGQPELRAGSHPDRLTTSLAFETAPGGEADGNARDVTIDLPPGYVGDADAVPRCARVQFVLDGCPPESRIGTTTVSFAGLGEQELPIYAIAPGPDDVIELGFVALVVPVRIGATLRAGDDYGTRIEVTDLPQDVPLVSIEIELWGVPADHQVGTAIPRTPFLTSPTRCEQAPLTGTVRVRSWQQPDSWLTATAPLGQPLVGCASLPFAPQIDVAPSRTDVDAPTGVGVELVLPQAGDPDGVATAHLEAASVALPEGLTLSPSAADGLAECSEQQVGLGSGAPPACPLASKVGSAELESPALTEELRGDIYLAEARPGDPYRLFLTARGPGFTVKLPASLRADPSTGRLTVVMADLPQLPFGRFTLRFKDGPRAPLAAPATCGIATTEARMTPYGGSPVTVSDAVVFGAGDPACAAPPPFAPLFVAGATPALAAAGSRFSTTLRRADGEQAIDRVTLDLPPGLVARLPAAARCPAALVEAASCPAASRVGSVVVAAGAGPLPYELPGATYLTGPYRGAPFGLALVIRAIAGPFDLGTVVVRSALRVDPADGHLTVETDRLPQILEGIPLRLRTLGIDVDRPGFMLNPTGCRSAAVESSIRSIDGATQTSRSRFALGGCDGLRFAPAVAVALAGRGVLHRPGRPQLEIRLRAPRRGARIRSAAVRLPRLLSLDPDVVSTLCTRRRARAGRCPRASRVGSSRARTPLLSKPLTGSVHLVQVEGRAIPELWAVLRGEGVRLVMRSTTSRPGQPVRSTFVDLPDLPLTAFTMRLAGGRGGLLVAADGLCRDRRARGMSAGTTLRAHNGARRDRRVQVRVRPSCRRG